MAGMKRCARCGEVKPPDQFYPRKSSAKPRGWCRPCSLAYSRERWRERRNLPALTTGEQRCRLCGETKALREFGEHRSYANGRDTRCRRCVAADAIRKKYGLTQEQVAALVARQGGGCGICRTREWGGKWGTPNIDHDHRTGKVRGALCASCNTRLAPLDDAEWYGAALAYLGDEA